MPAFSRLSFHVFQCLLGVALCLALVQLPAHAENPAEVETCDRLQAPVPSGVGAELPATLEILSWNIQKTSKSGWESDLARLGSGVDLAFIQEADPQAGMHSLMPSIAHQAFAEGYSRTGVMTLSTHQPGWHCTLSYREPWLGSAKATSVTAFPLAQRDEQLLAVNLHAVNFSLGLVDFTRQFATLRSLLALHQGPVILAGDLNTWNAGRQALVDQFTLEFGLTPVEFKPDLRTTAFGRALDHIYIRGMRAELAEVIPVSSSDHNPLRVRLALL